MYDADPTKVSNTAAAASADDTAAADTAMSDPPPETMIVPDVGQEPAAELAWSSDSDTTDYGASTERHTWRTTWVRAAAFAVGSAVVAGAIGGVWAWQRSAPTAPAPVSASPAAPAPSAPTIGQARNGYHGTAAAAGNGLRAAIPEISQVITITDTNDPNHMIGRAGGYTGAVMFIDTRTRHDGTEQCDVNALGPC